MAPVIKTEGLTKVFRGTLKAVDSVSIEVERGEVFGLLGPNGAGKSTMTKMLCTLLRPTSGKATIAGHDVVSDADKVRERIGLVSEKMILYDKLTAYENLKLFGKLYDIPSQKLDDRINELLELVQMSEWRDAQVEDFSTGMKQKINLIRGLIHAPGILFLDEPTLGLDPRSTLEVREFIKKINKEGTTTVLTTHYMAEADALCDRLGIIDRGRIIALDTPTGLKRMVSKDTSVLELRLPNIDEALISKIRSLQGVTKVSQMNSGSLHVHTAGADALNDIIATAQVNGGRVISIKNIEPTLEDVFLHITGRRIEKEITEPAASRGHHHWRRPRIR